MLHDVCKSLGKLNDLNELFLDCVKNMGKWGKLCILLCSRWRKRKQQQKYITFTLIIV